MSTAIVSFYESAFHITKPVAVRSIWWPTLINYLPPSNLVNQLCFAFFSLPNTGATFLINNLEANTTYLMRAATKNLAGLSDYTKVEKFHTLSNEPKSSSTHLEHLNATQLLCISLVALLLCKELSFGFQPVSSITKLRRAVGVRWWSKCGAINNRAVSKYASSSSSFLLGESALRKYGYGFQVIYTHDNSYYV